MAVFNVVIPAPRRKIIGLTPIYRGDVGIGNPVLSFSGLLFSDFFSDFGIDSAPARLYSAKKWVRRIMIPKAYAHSLPGKSKDEWQPLDEHLKAIAEKAKDFGLSFAGNIRIESAQEENYAFYRC